MIMAKTFNDFMIECEAYPHSQEHLDLMKECAELQLTAQYLDNQVYMQENAHLFGENVQLAAGYLTESVDDYTIEQLCESSKVKGDSIMYKIWKGIQKVLNVFRNFFSKLANKFDDTTVAAKKARDRLEEVEITDAVLERLTQIVANGKKKAENFVPHDRQPFTKKLKMKRADNSPAYTKLRSDLAAALSDDVSVAEAFAAKGTDNMGAIPAEDIESALESFVVNGKGSLAACMSNMSTTFASTKVDGIAIKVNTGEIKRTAERLEKIQEKLNRKVQQLVDESNALTNQISDVGAAVSGAAGKMAQGGEVQKESVEYFEEKKKSGSSKKGGSSDDSKGGLVQGVKDAGASAAQKANKLKDKAAKKASEAGAAAGAAASSAASAAGASLNAAASVGNAATVAASNKAYSAITVVIGATTKIYTGLNAYRTSVVNELNSYLKTVDTSGNATATATPEATPQGEQKDGAQASGEGDKK